MPREFSRLTLSEADRKILAVWAADCAERVLPLFERVAPLDTRPRKAVEGLRAFARGELRIGPVRALSANAHAAARDVGDEVAKAVARAAGHAAGVAHMGAHARGVAYAALAAGLANSNEPGAANEEMRWQIDHASAQIRDTLLQLPPPTRSRGALSVLMCNTHDAFTKESTQNPSRR